MPQGLGTRSRCLYGPYLRFTLERRAVASTSAHGIRRKLAIFATWQVSPIPAPYQPLSAAAPPPPRQSLLRCSRRATVRLAVFGENPRFLPRGKIGGFLATPAHDRLARPHRLGDLFFGVAGEPQFGSRYSAKTTDFGHVASFGSSFVRSLTVCRGAPTALAARDCGRCRRGRRHGL